MTSIQPLLDANRDCCACSVGPVWWYLLISSAQGFGFYWASLEVLMFISAGCSQGFQSFHTPALREGCMYTKNTHTYTHTNALSTLHATSLRSQNSAVRCMLGTVLILYIGCCGSTWCHLILLAVRERERGRERERELWIMEWLLHRPVAMETTRSSVYLTWMTKLKVFPLFFPTSAISMQLKESGVSARLTETRCLPHRAT